MRISWINAVLGFFVARSSCSHLSQHAYLERRMGDPITQMCYPNYEMIISPDADHAPSLINSPFPCEVQAAMQSLCFANGTTTLDFLAEQECLCNGAWFDVSRGCNNCFFIHGAADAYSPSDSDEFISALSTAECNATPTQPYQSMAVSLALTTTYLETKSLWIDQFPTNTAISNYWTATGSLTVGAITGSATGRATTNKWDFLSDSTTSTAPAVSTSSSGVSTSPTKSTSLSSPSGSKNVAAMNAIGPYGGLLTVLITFVVLK